MIMDAVSRSQLHFLLSHQIQYLFKNQFLISQSVRGSAFFVKMNPDIYPNPWP